MILEGKTILVTGGTGSLGRTLVHRILSNELGTPKKVIVLSRDEAKQHDMRVSYLSRRSPTDEVIYRNFLNVLEFRIGDVRDYADVRGAVRDADIVVNAAALKQVPSCEYFPNQAVLTNCIGASNIVRAVEEGGLGVETVVAISTDKACKPVNVMGMTKAIQERIVIAGNILSPRTRFIGVRYGNVLASRGSVIPLFHEQIRNGGPVTITVPEMTRFLLTLNQAVDTVFAALRGAKPGEIYVPRAPSATVKNLAEALVGERGIEIVVTGIRPGEKMHESIISEEEAVRVSDRGAYYAIRPLLPELGASDDDGQNPKLREFTSADNPLGKAATIDLLRAHKLMVEDGDVESTAELLR
jgi:UDP-glucose 4-epimerase